MNYTRTTLSFSLLLLLVFFIFWPLEKILGIRFNIFILMYIFTGLTLLSLLKISLFIKLKEKGAGVVMVPLFILIKAFVLGAIFMLLYYFKILSGYLWVFPFFLGFFGISSLEIRHLIKQ